MILTRYFTFAAPPKCGCLWFRQILRDQGIAVFGETVIETVDGFELQQARDSFRHHVPGRLPSITIRRNHEKWIKSYVHHFKDKKMLLPCDTFIGKDITLEGVGLMFLEYTSTYAIDLEDHPDLAVIKIFRELNIPHDANQILSLAPVNVTDFEVKA